MIIVSQDRKMIVNFKNVENIKIRELPANENGYAISVETFTSDFDRFAIYNTEERAKEVLQEIVKTTIETRKNQNFNSFFGGPGIIPENTYYEMPED